MNTRGHLELQDKTSRACHQVKVSLRAERSNLCLQKRLLRRLRLLAMTCSSPLLTFSFRGFFLLSFSKSLGLMLSVAFLLSACSTTVNWNYQRTPSTAFAQPQTTTVDPLFQEAADHHPGLSGFNLARQGGPAFIARLAMADLAEKSLDAQYYIWDGDTTGNILADRLMRAADRGVRVRVLIDDNYQTQKSDVGIATLDAHPNIEIRFFNPVTHRGWRRL